MSYKTTLLPDYVGVIQATSVDFYNKTTNILDAIGDYLAELNENIEFDKAKLSPDMLKAYGNLYNVLNATNFTVPNYNESGEEVGMKRMDNNFKMYFIEKYMSLSEEYKARVDESIQNNTLFKPFSDDIGMISDTVSVFDNSVNPIFDVYGTLYFTQTNIPASILNKISNNELTVSKTFSFYADCLLKKNLSLIQNNVSQITATLPHGTNLVTDLYYYNRSIVNQIPTLNVIRSVLGNLTSFVFFFKQLNPKDLDPERKAILFKYTNTNMENAIINLDTLKNQLTKLEVSSQFALS
jgi:hypothetical protein